jgi:hypothetical protein
MPERESPAPSECAFAVRLHAIGITSRAVRIQRFASCFLSAAVVGDASRVKVERRPERARVARQSRRAIP